MSCFFCNMAAAKNRFSYKKRNYRKGNKITTSINNEYFKIFKEIDVIRTF